MAAEEIEHKSYTEGTLVKLDIFQLYTRAWLPVFTAKPTPHWKRLHLFDFFAGQGRDCDGTPGSPTRILTEIGARSGEISSKGLEVSFTACDLNADKIASLRGYFASNNLVPACLTLDTRDGDFAQLFAHYLPILRDPNTACLVFLDQYGFKEVGAPVFAELTACPVTDILFFISTQHLHRFSDHPTVRKYMELDRAGDHYHAHRVILDWYRSNIPTGTEYYLAPFSFRKGSNIYSLIFGSGHPRGMEQFLGVAWQKDKLNGEADYDLNRENFSDIEPYLPIDFFSKPKKKQIFEAAFEKEIREERLTTETSLYLYCLENGMLPSHAAPVLSMLKKAGVVECDFLSPGRQSLKTPRAFRILNSNR
jgi:three-Cys-motif partner protein